MGGTGARRPLENVLVATDFSVAATRALFAIRARPANSSSDMWTYDVSRDGKRFLVDQAVRPERAPPLNVVLHADGLPPK